MGRTHEALQRAEAEYLSKIKSSAETGPTVPSEEPFLPAVQSRNGKSSYDDLKVNLRTRVADQTIRTILFCSTAHGDGSTTTATNFAAAMATDNKSKVLLVDANFRTPRLHDLCQIAPSPGISDYLGNSAKPVLPIRWRGLTNLSVLPYGDLQSCPLSLFESDRFDMFLKEMLEQFDYVILDGPPLPKFSELRVISKKVDAVVLVLRAGKTRRQVALRAKKELEEAGGKVLGVVLNRRKYYIPEWVYRRL